MKSFKQYIPEAKKTSNQDTNSSRIGYKSWITPEGKVIDIDPDNKFEDAGLDFHHLHHVIDNPKLYGTTTRKLKSIDPYNYEGLKSGETTWSIPILRDLGKRGYTRLTNFTKGSDHYYQISNHGYEGKHDNALFVPAVKRIKDHIEKTRVGGDSIEIVIDGHDGGTSKWTKYLRSMGAINRFINKSTISQPEKSSTQLPVVPPHFSHFTSTQRRAMLGRTPPQGSNIPQAIWNNIRTIGDSYNPMKSFKQYILESQEHPPYPWMQRGHAGWWHPTQPHMIWKGDGDYGKTDFHVTQLVRNPSHFGLTHQNIHDIITGADDLNQKYRRNLNISDDELMEKLNNRRIDNYPPLENELHKRGWVAVRYSQGIHMIGNEPALRLAVNRATLHVPPDKAEDVGFVMRDVGNNKMFSLYGTREAERYAKYGHIPPQEDRY